jgi:membrane protein implicated in regulation of membrane protease activity
VIEFLTTNLAWWHWVILGLILIVAEIIAPLFIILWFGISAIIVGLIDLGFKTSLQYELMIWIVLSVTFLLLWFKFFKDKDISRSGQSDATLGTKGVVIEDIVLHKKGKVQFDSPILGSSEWFAIANEDIKSGSTIQIAEVNGQLLKVTKTI